MENSKEISETEFWKVFIKKHEIAIIAVIIGGICLIIGALFVLFWFMEITPLGGQGTWTFNDWTLNYIVGFIILVILWELLFVGIPAGLFFGVGGYLWWRQLPEEEKQEFKARETTHKKKDWCGGGGFSFFMFIAYCIYIAVDGNYNAPLGSQSYTYWIYSWFLTLMWIIIVLGIPVGIILLIVYFTKWRPKSK